MDSRVRGNDEKKEMAAEIPAFTYNPIPANAGISRISKIRNKGIPAYAGMEEDSRLRRNGKYEDSRVRGNDQRRMRE